MKWIMGVDSLDDAKKATKSGMYGALAFAALSVLGVAFSVWSGLDTNGGSIGDEKVGYLVGASFEVLLALFAAFRFYRGKGWLIGAIVTVLFVAEVAAKLLGGVRPNIGFLVMDAAIIAMLWNGIRGAWATKRLAKIAVLDDTSA